MITFAQLGKYGRLGNGMFQIASTIGIAKRFGYQFAFPEWKNHDHKNRFGSTEDIDIQKYFLNPLPLTDDPGKFPDHPIPWGYHGGFIPDNVSISGHMQSERYFKHCEQDIRHYFRMRDERDNSQYTAIHWRAGDYQEGLDCYHPRMPMIYYERAMALFPADTKYLIFSDDTEAAKKMFGNNVDYSTGNDYIQDFKALKRCENFIIANSSYSLMGAILGEKEKKIIVAPDAWFGRHWGSCYRQMADDIYPENCKVVNVW